MIGFDVASKKGETFGGVVDMWEVRRQASYPHIHNRPFACRFQLGQEAVFGRKTILLKEVERSAFIRSAASMSLIAFAKGQGDHLRLG